MGKFEEYLNKYVINEDKHKSDEKVEEETYEVEDAISMISYIITDLKDMEKALTSGEYTIAYKEYLHSNQHYKDIKPILDKLLEIEL